MDEPIHDPEWRTLKSDLAARIRDVRIALYGEHGGPLVCSLREESRSGRFTTTKRAARSLASDSPLHSTWTGVDPHWLLTGDGAQFLIVIRSP